MAVFVSYVREDSRIVNHLVKIMRGNGLTVFLDRDSIQPGARWKDAIKSAIRSGDYFLAVFSSGHQARTASYANEELIQAIDMIRLMPRDRQWLIPIKIDDCQVPEYPIGAGETLHDLNWISFPDESYKGSVRRLLKAVGVENPIINFGEPLAPGYSSEFDLVSGTITYDSIDMPGQPLNGLVFYVSGGWCARQPEGNIAAQISVRAPHSGLEDVNKMVGLNKFFAVTDSSTISLSADNPTDFSYRRDYIIPKGTVIPPMLGQAGARISEDMSFTSHYIARGRLSENLFFGEWSGKLEFRLMGQHFNVPMQGSFEINVQPNDE